MTKAKKINTLKAIIQECEEYQWQRKETLFEIIKELEQEHNTAHWRAKSFHEVFCDNCGFDFDIMKNDFMDKMNFCPNCGAKIEREEQE